MEPLALSTAVLVAHGAAHHTGGSMAESALRWLQKLTGIVMQRFHGDNAAAGALDQARQSPQDERRIAELASHLARHIASDAVFAQALQEALAEAEGRTETGPMVTLVRDNAMVGKITSFGVVHGDVTF